jgi:Thymidylate kinase
MKLNPQANPYPGKLICFSGIHGVGKSTAAQEIYTYLQMRGVPCLLYKTPSAELKQYPPFRRYLDDETTVLRGTLDITALTLVSLGDALLRLRTEIIPALQADTWVICDRYLAEPVAGLLEAGPLTENDLQSVLAVGNLFLQPDLGFMFQAPVEVVLERITRRNRAGEKAENFDIAYSRQASEHFIQFALENRWILIDAAQPAEKVAAECGQAVIQLLAQSPEAK